MGLRRMAWPHVVPERLSYFGVKSSQETNINSPAWVNNFDFFPFYQYLSGSLTGFFDPHHLHWTKSLLQQLDTLCHVQLVSTQLRLLPHLEVAGLQLNPWLSLLLTHRASRGCPLPFAGSCPGRIYEPLASYKKCCFDLSCKYRSPQTIMLSKMVPPD